MGAEKELRDFVLNEIMRGEDAGQLDNEDNLIDSGVLDSMAMMQMVTHLEKTYAIKVETDDLVPETFQSIKALSDFVARKQKTDV